jgi:altronate dehydratase
MSDDIDIDCNEVIDGDEIPQDCGQRIFEQFLGVTSGERTCRKILDCGSNEFALCQLGGTFWGL